MTKRDSYTRTPRVLALLSAALILGTSTSPAVAQSLAETRSLSLDSVDVSTAGPLLLHARLASNLSQAPTNDSSTQGKGAKTPTRKSYLTLGLIGVGTAVAGLFVYRGANDHPHLPGIANGRETTGFVMMTVGGGFGTLGLIKAFR